jgi:hypothetical protein
MVTAVFRDREHAQEAYDWLLNRGYTSNDINILMSDATRSRYYVSGKKGSRMAAKSDVAEGAAVGGAVGTAVGATLAAAVAVAGGLAIPGVGLFLAGPAVAALAGGGAGAVTGGVIGALVGLGIPEPNAKAYEEALRDGGVVLGVVPHSSKDATAIKQYFEKHQGESVCYC